MLQDVIKGSAETDEPSVQGVFPPTDTTSSQIFRQEKKNFQKAIVD